MWSFVILKLLHLCFYLIAYSSFQEKAPEFNRGQSPK